MRWAESFIRLAQSNVMFLTAACGTFHWFKRLWVMSRANARSSSEPLLSSMQRDIACLTKSSKRRAESASRSVRSSALQPEGPIKEAPTVVGGLRNIGAPS
jgi:hypothetical protein